MRGKIRITKQDEFDTDATSEKEFWTDPDTGEEINLVKLTRFEYRREYDPCSDPYPDGKCPRRRANCRYNCDDWADRKNVIWDSEARFKETY